MIVMTKRRRRRRERRRMRIIRGEKAGRGRSNVIIDVREREGVSVGRK